MTAYYNEFDPFAAAWLRELIKAGHIAAGDVDERSITDVRPDDLKGYTQCHFFAGIGGWSRALRLAMWPDDRPVWTGSAPCQPFSAAGKLAGQSDERHLWPHWYRLILEYRPAAIFGEQVATAITAGWWDDVAADLEAAQYACAAAVLPACSVGAPHRRDRIWFVAYPELPEHTQPIQNRCDAVDTGQAEAERCKSPGSPTGLGSFLANAARNDERRTRQPGEIARPDQLPPRGHSLFMGDADSERSSQGYEAAPTARYWNSTSANGLVRCYDGKNRFIEPSIPLLANGVPQSVGKLRGFGNAIVPQVAAEFIIATDGWMMP